MFIWQRKLKYRLGLSGGRKRYVISNYAYKKNRRFFRCIKFAVICMILIFGITYASLNIENRISLLVNDMALSNLNSIVLRECNSAVSEIIEKYDISYSSLVNKNTDSNEAVKSLSVDYSKLNIMKSNLTNEVQKRIDKINSVDVSIPFMAFVSDRFYSGVGIPISLKVLTGENVQVDFCDEFISEGINQTKHLIKVKIITDIGINVPIRNNGEAIETEIPIAESIIVGDTPSTYINLK